MTPSMDQSRRVRAARHRAEPAAIFTTSPAEPQETDPSPGAHAAPAPGMELPTSDAPRGRRANRGARGTNDASTAALPTVAAMSEPASQPNSGPLETAAIGADAPTAALPTVAAMSEPASQPNSGPMETAAIGALAPAVQRRTVVAAERHAASFRGPRRAPFSPESQSVLKNAASVRLMSQRMAVVAGALAVLLGIGAVGQAADLPFFGKESPAEGSAQASAPSPDATGTDSFSHKASPSPTTAMASASATTPLSGAAGGVASANSPGDGTADPTPSPTPKLRISAGATGGLESAAPSPAPKITVSLAPPQAAAPSTTSPAPSPATSPSAPSPTAPPSTAPTPSPVPTASEVANAQAYTSTRLPSYGWGADQLEPLEELWNAPADWRPGQIDAGLKYIKERYGSPAKALEFRKANKTY